MQRLKLLGMMAALALMIAAVLAAASPYAPVIGPAPEIEAIWAIEDAREYTESPLVTRLENHGVPLAYDAAENTFYCTLGMENGETWPDIHLTAPDARDVSLVFVDDYSYDWCADAIRDGYSYEAMAYTDTEYAYFNIVFTGLTQLCIETDGAEISTEADTPIRVTMGAWGEAPLETSARIHLRGASALLFEKKNYKLEFTRERGGEEKKIRRDVPGFGQADELVLLPCWHDETKMRDMLNWTLWNEIAADAEPFGARKTGYAEVFLNGEYLGLYMMLEPVNVVRELSLAGENRLLTDSVYRTAALNFSRDREYIKHPYRDNAGYELYYSPNAQDPFAGLQAYLELMQTEGDEEFAARAMEILDVDSMLRQQLFVQGCALADNIFNNMYIWAQATPEGVTYRFAPWDLDLSWGLERESVGEEYQNWMYFPVSDRLMNLDADGMRQRAYDMWQQMRATIFNEEALEARLAEYTFLLGESGALMRDAWRWGSEMSYPDPIELISVTAMRWPLIDEAMETLIAAEGPVDFLSQTNYEVKGGALR